MSEPLTVKTILRDFLCLFEVAVEERPWYAPLYNTIREVHFAHLPDNLRLAKVWEFTRDRSFESTRDPANMDSLSAEVQEVHRSLRKRNLCDYFCLMLAIPVRRKLEGTLLDMHLPSTY